MTPIHLRNVPPPPETFDHITLLKFFANWIKPERYLELGVRWGNVFLKVAPLCKEAHCVDMNDIKFRLKKNMSFHKCSTDDYFEKLSKDELFDMIFIDADHSFEQSKKDFVNASRHLIDDGFIFLHDTYPYDPKFFEPEWCNDAYRTPLWIKQNMIDEFEIVTLPFNPGLTIVKKMNRNKQLQYLD